jgi:hypothetical protein
LIVDSFFLGVSKHLCPAFGAAWRPCLIEKEKHASPYKNQE